MKKILREIVIYILILEARLVLWRFKPKVVAITGSVGKTTAKDAIHTALSSRYTVRSSKKSFNTEFGVPLTILNLPTGWSNIFLWLWNIIRGFLVLFSFKYPEWLVLETGVDKPGDMERTAKWLEPDIAVFTSFGTVPVHVENFSSVEELWREKGKLARYVKEGGSIVLNADDKNVMKVREGSNKNVVTFSKEGNANIVVSHSEVEYVDGKPVGISFKLDIGSSSVPVRIDGVLGFQHMYPVAAAMAVGKVEGGKVLEMAEAFRGYKTSKGRMRILDGKNDSVLIDDSYNASPVAMQAALSVLGDLKVSGKKIAVLGDMLEIGMHSDKEHRYVGEMVAKCGIDYLVTVGSYSRSIGEEALKRGMDEDRVLHLDSSEEVLENERVQKIFSTLGNGDVILVKGSQSIRTEKIVKSLLADPDIANELLVRQEEEWGRK